MRGPGILALGVLLSCGAAEASDRAARSTGVRWGHGGRASTPKIAIPSPDRRQRVTVTASGRVQLNGRPVRCGAGRVVGRPVWRPDSRAVAFLLRSTLGWMVVVVPDMAEQQPLVWRLPYRAQPLRKLFWVGPQRVGIGARELIPELVVSWSTQILGG